jgi:hypothetical protein
MKRTRTKALLLPIILLATFTPAPGAGPAPAQGDAAETDTIVAYYFYTTYRCSTCVRIEQLAREVVEQDFADQVGRGRLEWRAVNVEWPQNRHFIRKYRLVTRSVVLVRMVEGKETQWKNLDRVWQLVWSRDRYRNYVISEINAFLGG